MKLCFFHQNLKNQMRRLKQQEDSVVVCIYCCSSSSLFSLLLWFLNESRRRQQSFLSLFLTLTNNLRVLLPRFMNDVNSSSNFGKGYLAPGSVSQEVTGSSGWSAGKVPAVESLLDPQLSGWKYKKKKGQKGFKSFNSKETLAYYWQSLVLPDACLLTFIIQQLY